MVISLHCNVISSPVHCIASAPNAVTPLQNIIIIINGIYIAQVRKGHKCAKHCGDPVVVSRLRCCKSVHFNNRRSVQSNRQRAASSPHTHLCNCIRLCISGFGLRRTVPITLPCHRLGLDKFQSDQEVLYDYKTGVRFTKYLTIYHTIIVSLS